MTLTPNRCIDNCCDGCGCNVTKDDIGLGNVDNTSDANKPISTAVQAALSSKASASTVSTLGSNVTALDSRVSAIEGTFVTLGTTQSITGDKTFNGDTEVPNTTLGDTSAKAVNGSRLMAEINNLSGYVTVAGVQAITGDKNFTGDTQFSGDVQMDAVVLVNGSATFKSNVVFDDPITVNDTATFNQNTVVPTTATGDTSTKAVNGTRLMNEINGYAPMVRTTGNQTIGGTKTFEIAPYGFRSSFQLSGSDSGYIIFGKLAYHSTEGSNLILALAGRNIQGIVGITIGRDSLNYPITLTDLCGNASTYYDFGFFEKDGEYYIGIKVITPINTGIAIDLMVHNRNRYQAVDGSYGLFQTVISDLTGYTALSNTE